MKLQHTLLTACALTATLSAQAQTITFDTDDYKAVSVYDSWTDSPIRTGEITPAVGVLDNHLTSDTNSETGEPLNATARIAGLQRSRYGSNLCGLKVDLNETFRLTKDSRYVHVLVNRPVSDSRLMLITLGKRSERAGQSTDVEQTWSLCSTTAETDQWFDAVFEISGFSYDDTEQDGIDIYSLVICPDVTDRSTMESDFICYIDEIEVNESRVSRTAVTYYPLNFDTDQANTRTDRALNGVALSDGTTVHSWTSDASYIYTDATRQGMPATVEPSQSLTPSVQYTGSWMSSFAYIDWNCDGAFSYDVNDDGTPADGSEVVSYNGANLSSGWHNSLGESVSNGNQVQNGMPAFTVPDDVQPGIYRMRYKVDWASLDPGGNPNSSNTITANGGGITDVLINVRATETLVTASQLNGDIVNATTGAALNGVSVAQGESLRIKVVPANGFTYNGVKVTCGYNLSGDSLQTGNLQHFTTTLPPSAFDEMELTLPDSLMAFGEVMLEGLMVQENLVVLVDTTVSNPTLTEISMNGTAVTLAQQTFTLSDNTHSLQDLTQEGSVGLTHGLTLSSSEEGTLYIDLNRDGQFSAATEQIDESGSIEQEGFFRALLQTEQYQFLFIINLHDTEVTLKTDITHGRLISRNKTVDNEVLYTTGVPTATTAFKFLGLIAQPMVDGYLLPDSATVRYGYQLDDDQTLQGIAQWQEEQVAMDSTGRVNIPYYKMYGTVRVTAECEPADDCNMTLAFDDEFDGTTIDDTKWSIRSRASSVWNRFISDNPNVTFIDDGALVCRARKNVFDSTDDADMLSGMRQSSGHYSMLHGYVEARVLTTPHTGNFPAFWMMPDDQSDGWPVCGEIDIWESINTESRTYHTVHSNWTYNLGNTSNPTSSSNCTYEMENEWHTFGLLKQAGKMTWYVDGTEVFSYSKSTNESDLDQGQWPFEKAFYVILNQSVGNGSWAAAYDDSFVYETRFDWVRAYEYVDDTDGIDGVKAETCATAMCDGVIYDLSGRPATGHQKGIYVVNGEKKVIR